MESSHLYNLCYTKAWDEVQKYLASDASEKDKKEQVSYQQYRSTRTRYTCLHWACIKRAPTDIFKSLIAIGGRELVMMRTGFQNRTALHHSACNNRASFNAMKMLINVGGKDLVMVKDSDGDTALHCLCCSAQRYNRNPADKIKLFLEAADTEKILEAKNNTGKTPLELAVVAKASSEIKNLLRPSQPSIVVLNNGKATTESNKRRKRQVTPSKQCTASPITPVEEDTSIPSSLDTIRKLEEQLKEANDRARKIQQDLDEKCADNINLQNTLQVESAIKHQFEGALLQKGEQVENLQSEITSLKQQVISSEQSNKRHHEMEDDANNASQSVGGKRKRGNDEGHTFTSDEIEGSTGDINADKMVMGQYLLERKLHSKERKLHSKERKHHSKERKQYSKERKHHSKVLTHFVETRRKLVETRRELRIVRSQLKNDTGTDTSTLQQQGIN